MSDDARVNGPRDASVVAPFALLAVSFILLDVVPYLSSRATVPWFVALTVAAAAIRFWGSRAPDRSPRAKTAFWVGLVVNFVLVLLNPAFGLYGFIAYPDSTRQFRGLQRWFALLGVAAMVAVAQAGGLGSPLVTVPIWLLFVLVNLIVAGSMHVFDRQRQRQSEILRSVNEDLRIAQTRNAALQERLLDQAHQSGVEEERSRLAREIHDTIAQDLVAIITQLAVIADEPNPDERRRRLDQMESTARGALGEARRSVQALSSPRLDSDDLPAALERLRSSWQAAAGVSARVEVEGQPRPSDHDDVILRIAQEALANVARHAAATEVQVRLRYSCDGLLTLQVIDDGAGFDPGNSASAWSRGHGLSNMTERARAAGGDLCILSAPDVGTTVSAAIPGRWR